jgi:transposase
MRIVYTICCGLDVHKRTVTACLLKWGAQGRGVKEVRTFSTTTRGLLELADWLTGQGCQHVAMESTGVYWKPVHNILSGACSEVLLVNAQHVKNVPGRKTDVKDSEWIAELLSFGLLRGSFVPPPEIRELRDLTRYRTTLIRQRADQC